MLDALARNAEISILVCAGPASITRVSPYWDKPFEAICKTREFVNYFRLNPGDARPACASSFRELLNKSQAATEDSLRRKGAKIYQLDQEHSNGGGETALFLWSADGEDSIFLMPDAEVELRGLAFRTRDSKLIEILESTFDRKMKLISALKVQPKDYPQHVHYNWSPTEASKKTT